MEFKSMNDTDMQIWRYMEMTLKDFAMLICKKGFAFQKARKGQSVG